MNFVSFSRSHIPNSIYYDAWQCVNRTDLIPNNIPDKDCFEDYVKRLGINSDTRVVVYDRIGSLPAYKNKRHSKPSFRALWLFRVSTNKIYKVLHWKQKNTSSRKHACIILTPLKPHVYIVKFWFVIVALPGLFSYLFWG